MGQVSSRLSNLFNDQPSKEEPKSNFQIKKFRQLDKPRLYPEENLQNENDRNGITFSPANSFATPRLPLKRSREISPVASALPQVFLDLISPCTKKLKMEEEYLDFPFLNDRQTIDYLRKCKVMFIMRGVPGSGKSTITKSLRKNYTSVQICSADDYFMIDMIYHYDAKKIGDAHKYCKQKAVDAAIAEVMHIVIDNTNIKFWEMKFYLDLAKEFYYIPIIVEPKTPWKNNISALVEKNSHNLDEKAITMKIKSFEKLNPIYYGWFLNDKDSYLLNVEGQSWIEEAFKFDLFKNDLLSYSGIGDFNEFLKVYTLPGNSPVFHVTSKYTAKKRKAPEMAAYIEKEEVEKAIGSIYDLEIIGFIVTPRTLGARVKLTNEQELLWGGDDEESIPENFWCPQKNNTEITSLVESLNEEKPDEVENSMQVESQVEIHIESHKNNEECTQIRTELEVVSRAKELITETPLKEFCDNGNGKICEEVLDFPQSNALIKVENMSPVKINGSDNLSVFHNISSEEETKTDENLENNGNDLNSNEAINSEEGLQNQNTSVKKFKNFNSSKNKVSPTKKESKLTNSKLSSPSKMESQKLVLSPNKNKSPSKQQDIPIPENIIKPNESRALATIKEIPNDTKNKFHPSSEKGRRAHVTLACKSDIKPVTTGLDLLFAIELEAKALKDNDNDLCELNASMDDMGVQDQQKSLKFKSDVGFRNKSLQQSIALNGATARNYGYGVWVIYLDNKLVVSSLFNCNC